MTELSAAQLRAIRRIHIQMEHLATDVLAGAWRSVFKGRGMEFEEVREYQVGDEIRSIDWNVTARMNHPYIKQYREERDLTIMLLVDISSSTRFGTRNRSKGDLIAEIGAIISFTAIKNNDKVGLILFSEDIELYIPPKKGLRHVLRVIRELLSYTPRKKGTNMADALKFLGTVHSRSCVAFILSDFMCGDFSKELAVLAKEHDCIAIEINDPAETILPDIGLANVSDLETGETQIIDTSDGKIRSYFQNVTVQRGLYLKGLMTQTGAGFISVRTDQPYIANLRKFFKLRQKRIL
jgi:uncharacterized protein (DUF58 family)